MNMERIKKNIIIKFIIFGSLTFLFVTVAANINYSFSGLFVQDENRTAEMVRTGDRNTVTFNELSKLKNKAVFDKATGYSESISTVSNKFGCTVSDIKVVLTDADYASVYKNDILAGDFPDEKAVKMGEACVVISDQLAVELFKSIDIIGNEIWALGRKYTVSGVYKSSGSILYSMCGDGFDRIFIPYSSIDNYTEMPVDVIALLGKPDQSMINISRILDERFGGKISSYRMIDHSTTGVVFHQYFDLLLFAIGAMAILLTLIFFVKYSIREIKYIKGKTDSYYVSMLLKIEVKSVIRYLLVFLLCSICVILLMKCMQFKFIIADKYIPDDNIFDIRFYMKAFMDNRMTSNLYSSNIYSIFEYTCKNAFQIEIICVLGVIAFFVTAIMFFKLLVALDMNFLSIIKLVLISILAGGGTGICISIFSGLGAILPFKSWIIVLYFLLILYGVYSRHFADSMRYIVNYDLDG